MDGEFCKSSSENKLDGDTNLCFEAEEFLSSETKFSSAETFNINEKEVKDDNEENENNKNSEKLGTSWGSIKSSESPNQKSLSPTLIEQAFKVMKNLFSPDKTRNKPATVISPTTHQRNSSTPRSSVYIPNKSDLCTSDTDEEVSNKIKPLDSNAKREHLNLNELKGFPSSPIENHSNGDDSFITTVSLVDDSFHSAVTHIEGSVMSFKHGEKCLNSSQNLELYNSFNDSFENSGSYSENTVIKSGSFKNEKEKLNGLNNTQVFFNSKENNECKFVGTEDQIEELVEAGFTKDDKSVINNCTNLKTAKEFGIDAENKSVISKDSEVIKELGNKNQSKEVENIFLKKSFEDLTKTLTQNDFPVDNELFSPVAQEFHVGKYSDNQDEAEKKESQSFEAEGLIEESISKATIVLNSCESSEVENLLSNLKADDSETNMSSGSFENSEVNFLVDKFPLKTTEEAFCEKLEHLDNIVDKEKNSVLLNSSKPNGKSPISSPNKHSNQKKKLNNSINVNNKKSPSNSRKEKKVSSLNSSVDVPNKDLKGKKKSLSPNCALKSTKFEVASEIILKPRDELTEHMAKPESPLHWGNSDEPDSISVFSQQSYTVLNTESSSLKRPMISSSDDISIKSHPDLSQDLNLKSTATFCKETESSIKETNGSIENANLIKAPKQSTPICDLNDFNKDFDSSSTQTFVKPNSLNISSEGFIELENEEISCYDSKKSDVSANTTQILFSEQEPCRLSPVVSLKTTPLISCSESEKNFELNNTWIIPTKSSEEEGANKSKSPSPNKTSGKSKSSGANKPQSVKLNELNQADTNPSMEISNSSSVHVLNQTFDKKSKSPEPKMNETFEKKTEVVNNLSRTFDEKSKSPEIKMNQTFEKKTEVVNNLSQTFDEKSKSPEIKMNQTFEKKNSALDQTFVKAPHIESPKQSENELEVTHVISTSEKKIARVEPTPSVQTTIRLEKPPILKASSETKKNDVLEVNTCSDVRSQNCVSSSNLKTPSNNKIVLFNGEVPEIKTLDNPKIEETSTHLVDDKMKKTAYENWSDEGSTTLKAEDQAFFAEDKFSEEKCEMDLVQMIQEQFSSTEIEKICSVVDDFSSIKLSSQILKASEQFDKSFHEAAAKGDFKLLPTDSKEEKEISPLTPQGFEFLSSISGKPTGRDLSRESLYVKFDPLVQLPPNSNSLIDFTREAEIPTEGDSSLKMESTPNLYEQLLTISPEKKSDDIVPPLTPLSNKQKGNNADRLRELKNEIYFLRNQYSERDKANKMRMDAYESQIAKLTGENCMLEDKIKESTEREKSLVKKIQEQAHSINQVKVIMEEYVKMISKLIMELENLKEENKKQVDAQTALAAEKDSYVTHLQNTEAAFVDVHVKYEKSKKTIASLKANEAMYKNTLTEQNHKLENFKEKARMAQEKACKEFQKVQEELVEMKTNHGQETARLRAQLRKTELKLEAIQEALDQKIKENEQLTAICDDLIEGKK